MDSDYIIEVRNLVKKFDSITAVDDISFKVKRGEVFAFLGPNGAGKSTTIKILTTLLNPTKGTISLNGFDVLKEKNKVRDSFGIVFQEASVDEELTARENMEFHAVLYKIPKQERKEKIDTLLKFIGLDEWGDVFVKKFSGGMKRRLEIARGLLHHPKVLFLDEPSLGLDPQTRTQIWEHIMKLNKERQMTVFLTTHYIEEAEKMADRVAIIDHGKIIKRGTPEEIMKDTGSDSLEGAFLALTGRQIRE
jgi:ABC-2 type transport system ATP-binding protein